MHDNTEILPCNDKLRFDTQKAARATATTLRHQHGTAYHVYKCRHCGLWHLSSQPAD